MSALLVDPEHINVMVWAAMQPGDPFYWHPTGESECYGYRAEYARTDTADRVGQMLLDQNAASLTARYGDDESYVYGYQRPQSTEWQPIEILSAIHCYEYQACESPDWRETEAYTFCQALAKRMIGKIAGYSSGPWEITPSSVPAHVAKRAELVAEQRAKVEAARVELVESRPGSGVASAKVLPFPRMVAIADDPAPAAPAVSTSVDRDTAIKTIRTALRRRSGKAWSVTGGRGTAWGWINISAPPKRCGEYGSMTAEDAAELGELLGLGRPAHHQGVSVAASSDYRREYIARAEGRTPDEIATPYWD